MIKKKKKIPQNGVSCEKLMMFFQMCAPIVNAYVVQDDDSDDDDGEEEDYAAARAWQVVLFNRFFIALP